MEEFLVIVSKHEIKRKVPLQVLRKNEKVFPPGLTLPLYFGWSGDVSKSGGVEVLDEASLDVRLTF